MPITLAPITGPGGVIIWDGHAIALHVFWVWQFAISCFLNFFGFLTILFSGMGRGPKAYEWCIVAADFLLTIVVLAEVCIFANGSLSSNRFLVIEVLKMCYVGVLCALFEGYMDYPFTQVRVVDYVLTVAISVTPWVATAIYAIVVRCMQWKERPDRHQDADAGEEGTTHRPVDEETPLLGSVPVITEGTRWRDMENRGTEKHLYHPSAGPSD